METPNAGLTKLPEKFCQIIIHSLSENEKKAFNKKWFISHCSNGHVECCSDNFADTILPESRHFSRSVSEKNS